MSYNDAKKIASELTPNAVKYWLKHFYHDCCIDDTTYSDADYRDILTMYLFNLPPCPPEKIEEDAFYNWNKNLTTDFISGN